VLPFPAGAGLDSTGSPVRPWRVNLPATRRSRSTGSVRHREAAIPTGAQDRSRMPAM